MFHHLMFSCLLGVINKWNCQTFYFVKNQTWKTNSNQSSVVEDAALKARESIE